MSAKDIERLVDAAVEASTLGDEVADWPIIVRAILQAMREPSEGMLDSGGKRLEAGDCKLGYAWTYALDAWQAMIDHILSA